jgi:uroporphyrinogen decarboxylase
MTSLENLSMLMGGRAERIPFTLDVGAIPGFTAPVMNTFRQKTGSDRPEEFFDYDFRTASLSARFAGDDPAALHASVEPGTTFDEWGIGHWAGEMVGTYEKTFPPLERAGSIAEVESLPTPLIDVGETDKVVQGYHTRGYPVLGYAGSVYEWSWFLRGMQAFMVDLVINTRVAEAIIRKVTDYTKSLALASAQSGIDVLCFYDDAGMQTGMQLSPEMWRRFIKPRWREILDAVRRAYPDRLFFLHSCGKIEAIIPDIIEIGFHILHPVQPECMEFSAVRAEYGRHLVLCACLSAQKTLPFGTPDDVKKWVSGVRKLCASDNRVIMCPSNMIQPETPWENIVAFAEAARSLD